jgi:hypothetical protein
MKKILLIASFVAVIATTFAQTTTPRTGTKKNQDNTYRGLDIKYVDVNKDATGLDTITLNPSAFHTMVYFDSLVDSVAFKIGSITPAYFGDKLEFHFTNSSSGKVVRWAGGNWDPATVTIGSQGGAVYLTASKKATVVFHFDGRKWVEAYRTIQ